MPAGLEAPCELTNDGFDAATRSEVVVRDENSHAKLGRIHLERKSFHRIFFVFREDVPTDQAAVAKRLG